MKKRNLTMRVKFGTTLKRLRLSANLTQKELAAIFNVSKSTVGKWETGLQYPKLDKLIKIVSYFNVSVNYLLGLS